jgi:phospholipid transport system substrate-binding protein
LKLEYVLRQDGGTWRAYDVVTDGVGLVENYRAQFNKIIAKEGFDGLIARMQKMQKKLSQQG